MNGKLGSGTGLLEKSMSTQAFRSFTNTPIRTHLDTFPPWYQLTQAFKF